MSRIHFTSPNHAKTVNKDDKKEAKKIKTDADGDFVVERSRPKDGVEHHTITIGEVNSLQYELFWNVRRGTNEKVHKKV